MSIERDDRDDVTGVGADSSEGGGTHGGLAIGRTTGMGAGIAQGGTPGADEEGGAAKGGAKGGASKKGASKGGAAKGKRRR